MSFDILKDPMNKSKHILCLLVHHGVWNENDHDVFKCIIASCKHMLKYVSFNKSLVRKIFNCVAVLRNIHFTNGDNVVWYEVNDKREGKYTHRHINGSLWSLCLFKNGKKEGEEFAWYSNGHKCTRCFYRDDKIHGNFFMWWNNGKLNIKSFYQNGNLTKRLRWFTNGQLAERTFYKNNVLDGECTLWLDTGEMYHKFIYQNGVLVKDILDS